MITSGELLLTNEDFTKPLLYMNNQATLSLLRELSLTGMADAFESMLRLPLDKQATADELIARLTHAEQLHRQHRRTQTCIKQARFRYQACVEEIAYNGERNLDKNLMLRLLDTSYIQRSENVLITGATGCGKSFIATALGYQACEQGLRVAYFSMAKLLHRLHLAKADGSYSKELAKLERLHLLILDDWGLQAMDLNAKMAVLQIIEDRHGKHSTIITSQLPVLAWYDYIGEPTLADAILDRLLHETHRLELKGESMRKRKELSPESSLPLEMKD